VQKERGDLVDIMERTMREVNMMGTYSTLVNKVRRRGKKREEEGGENYYSCINSSPPPLPFPFLSSIYNR